MRLARRPRGDPRAPRPIALIAAVVSLAVVSLGAWTALSLFAPATAVARPATDPPASDTDSPSVQRESWADGTGPLDTQRRPILPRGRTLPGARADRPGATLSGTLIKGSAAVTTTWALYPGACVERSLGIWAPKSFPVADSLQPTTGFPYSDAYTVGQPAGAGGNAIGYTRVDRSIPEVLWHVVSSSVPADQRPAIISGQRMLWCGKYDPGCACNTYPNNTRQILYIDTGAHAAPYYLMFDGNISVEWDFDYVEFVGGGDGERDPLGNCRSALEYYDGLGCGETVRHPEKLVLFTGNFVGGDFPALGQTESRMEGPATGQYRIGPIAAEHRAIYIVFGTDAAVRWGEGIQLDNIDTSDNGAIYTDQAPVGGVDEYGGQVVLGTPASPVISCRVFPGYGMYWSLASGASAPTADLCAPPRAASGLFFENGDPATQTAVVPARDEIRTCSIPVPPGTGRIYWSWDSYGGQGCEHTYSAAIETCVGGIWASWWAGYVGGYTWDHWDSGEALLPAGTDSVRLSFNVSCNGEGAQPLILDNLGIRFVGGDLPPPAPWFSYWWGPRSTFIDGTMTGTYCSQTPCWPNGPDVDDNWNDENGGDRVTIWMGSTLSEGDDGVNWRTQNGDFAHPRSGYNPAFDVPRMIYRLFDPATLTWSPWDSAEIMCCFYMDWPPPDKVASGASLPGGFTINGVGSYAALSWLPRGTRMQFYWKNVDTQGGVAYSFYAHWYPQWSTLDDGEYPNLPCHDSPGCVGPKAPEINEWRVLPGVYAPGPPGSLLAGRTNTPILVLDDRYGPAAQALRALGVRADRHPNLELGGHQVNSTGFRDHWPNYQDYAIIDSLAAWYRMVIVPMYNRGGFEGGDIGANMTAEELSRWLETDTGPDGGDRCLFVDGNDGLSSLLGSNRSTQVNFAQQTLGVASASEVWSGYAVTPYPNLDDRFSAPISGAGLAAAGTYVYPVDGGCRPLRGSGPWDGGDTRADHFSAPRFDVLTRVVDVDTQDGLLYPNGQVAGVARMRELDTTADKDRQKTLANGFSLEYARDSGVSPTSPSYDGTGISARAQLLYKFLTSCRGPRTSATADTGKCWPCPTPGSAMSVMRSEWSGMSAGFQTSKYGPLYPIQAGLTATGIFAEDAAGSAPRVNRIEGNYPNPFNPRTTLRFTSASAGQAEIRIFGVGGRLVRELRTRVQEGPNEVAWDGRGTNGRPLASGVYFYTVRFPDAKSLVGPNHLVIVK